MAQNEQKALIESPADRSRVSNLLLGQIAALQFEAQNIENGKSTERHFAAICALRGIYRVCVGGVPAVCVGDQQ